MYEFRPNKNKQGKPAYVGGEKMKNKAKQYEEEILEVIEKHKICRVEHIFGLYGGLRKTQFYNLKLNESNAIKEAIEKNRIKATTYLLNKWIVSDNPTLQIAAMRLVCSKEEHMLLNQQYIDHTTKGESVKPTIIVASEQGKKALEDLNAAD